jgi:SAM-dependent methyltransferase
MGRPEGHGLGTGDHGGLAPVADRRGDGPQAVTGRSRVARCAVCRSADIQPFVLMPQLPVYCNVPWPTREEALGAPRADIELGFCRRCGHVCNLAFRPELMEYTQAYDSSLVFSPRFQQYSESLARRLVERYDLHGKDIIDIGCGKGEFLTLLCDLGGNRGVGFDPAFVPDRGGSVAAEQVTFVQDYYSEEYADYSADLVCCRHVLEHLHDPLEFLNMVRRAVDGLPDAVVYLEVPNVLYTLRDLGIWDIIYEHYSYFSAASLAHAAALCDLHVLDLYEAYGGQFLCLEASPAGRSADSFSQDHVLSETARGAVAFGDEYRRKVQVWQIFLQELAVAGHQAVVWGAGSKGVSFLNSVKAASRIGHAVDLNPHKQGKYVAGTGQRIVAPDYLQDQPPDVVIVMNPLYRQEIQQMTEQLGVKAGFRVA